MKRLLALFLLTAMTPGALAQTADWQKNWDETLAAARKEGKVVVLAPPDAHLRQTLPAAFKERFGIALEYLSGRSSETAAKIRAERSAGIYSIDVVMAGIQTMSTVYHREKMLAPLKPALILPEVVDGAKWKKGKIWFVDPEEQYVLRLFNTVNEAFNINTQHVKPEDLRSVRDLLDPKWKGKIAFMDPTVSGTGSNQAAQLYVQFGEEFVRKLLIDQKPVISRDRRQLTDWLVRGTYPIAFGAEDGELLRMRKEGMPVAPMFSLSDMPGSVSGGDQIGLMANAPHPNAAKIFVNWMASREGSEVFSRAFNMVPARNDVGEESFLASEVIPKPGVDYFDPYEWEFTVTTKEKARQWIKEMLGAAR
jgi:iron(III) transport system substrate-binding protein